MLKNNRYWRKFDWFSFGLMLAIATLGILFIYSSTHTATTSHPIFFKKQLLGLVSGLFIYFLTSWIDLRHATRQGYILYYTIIGLLVFTIIKGSIGMGAQRWINLGFIKFQPSELTKLYLPSFIAYKLESDHNQKNHDNTFFNILIFLFISTALIIKQPDLGTGLIVLFTGLIVLWMAGLKTKFFKIGIITIAILAPVGWKVLHSYQKKRIEVFLGFGSDKKEAYHIKQSKIAIGSGGLLGKGFLGGTQNKLSFLPEGRTDFIFAVICEEVGLLGAIFVILLYLALFLHLIMQITNINDHFTRLLTLGFLTHIILSAIINIGMVLGLLPIVGIPLPLVSYGVSNLWITMASLGFIQNAIIRSK